ncbi:MAG: hypothetical protein ACM3SS_10610 [Rhodospirillaceae bacterium]
MMRGLWWRAAALALLGLGGCATAPTPPEGDVQPAEVIDAVRVVDQPVPRVVLPQAPVVDETALALTYFDRVRRLPSAELVRELDVMRSTYGRTHADGDRLRLAMLLALPNTAVTDDARALDLLDPIVKTPAHALHHVAVLLSTYVQEQRRLTQSAQALQKDVQTLQQKLDALRSLERALSEREGVIPRRR